MRAIQTHEGHLKHLPNIERKLPALLSQRNKIGLYCVTVIYFRKNSVHFLLEIQLSEGASMVTLVGNPPKIKSVDLWWYKRVKNNLVKIIKANLRKDKTKHGVIVFTLPDTQTDTETGKNGLCRLCGGVHTTQRQMTIQISIGFCVHVRCLSRYRSLAV